MDNDSTPGALGSNDQLGLADRLRTRPTGDAYLHMMMHEAADEIERLTKALRQSNAQAERFERGVGLGDHIGAARGFDGVNLPLQVVTLGNQGCERHGCTSRTSSVRCE